MSVAKALRPLGVLLTLVTVVLAVVFGAAISSAAPVTNDKDVVFVAADGVQVDIDASASVDTETEVAVSDDGVQATTSIDVDVNTGATVKIDVGGTWDKESTFLPALIAPFYQPGHDHNIIKIVYPAGGFDLSDLLDGVTYDRSVQIGADNTSAVIQNAVIDGKTVDSDGFSQGTTSLAYGVCDAIAKGVDPNAVNVVAVASPVDPISGLQVWAPAGIPGISKDAGNGTCGAPTQWVCIGGDGVCDAPDNLVEAADAVAGYIKIHSAKGRGCTYANLANCDYQLYEWTLGNQKFTRIVTESPLVEAFEDAGMPLPEFAKNVVRDIVADGRPAYRPTTPEPAPAATPIKMVIPLSESLAPEPAPIIIPDLAPAAHDFVNGLGLDPGATDMLNNVVGGLFAR